MSNTPLTDAAECRLCNVLQTWPLYEKVVDADFARGLEVELSVLKSKVAEPHWQSFDTAPKEQGVIIEAWHVIHKCVVTLQYRPDAEWKFSWLERSYIGCWPADTFSHWCPLSAGPEEG